MTKNKTLKKGAFFTDIHFGKKSNSKSHNEDCIKFIEWFCKKVAADPEIDYVGFLGDWNENRSSLNIATLNYSYQGAKMLNELNLPVYFVIGNHDLYHRHTRDIHSIIPFTEFDNFIIIDQPQVIEEIEGKALLSPFLFNDEYADMVQYLKIPFWAGHFEFKGFLVTGYGIRMPTGPDPRDFKGPKHIISGHFHKRQISNNIIYMGNCFPMDFGDAGDNKRGMMKYDHVARMYEFIDWKDCPKYISVDLTSLLSGNIKIYPNSRVKCVVDVPISYEESTLIRETFTEKYDLREFTMEESAEIQAAMSETETEVDWEETEWVSTDELVLHMLGDIDTPHINNDMLINIYTKLQSSELAPDKN